MSYLVLARKYRPKDFESIVGQDHVVRALTHALESGRLHHAYLFTGTRGIGKTTLSRILAKALNCEKGITASPCGICEACRAIDSDRFVDYVEMDAASNRGIADMLQILEQAVYAPTAARFKVYMIDEVHMLTQQAFNAMLKTLEEPPEYVKFILATTDPQKIPVTVLSRCLQFNLKQMPVPQIVTHLDGILVKEGIACEKTALQLLAKGAHGSMRDALSLTDQAIAYTAGNVTAQAVQDMLGALDQTYLIRLLDCLAARDGAGLLAITDEMAARSLSYNTALQDLGNLLHRIAVIQQVPDYLPEELPDYADLSRLARAFSPEEIQLYYQIAIHGRDELGLAPDEYAGFSMTLLRMLAFVPDDRNGNHPAGKPENIRPTVKKTVASAADRTQYATASDAKTDDMQRQSVRTMTNMPRKSAVIAVSVEQGRVAGDGVAGIAETVRPEKEVVTADDKTKQDAVPAVSHPEKKRFPVWDGDWPTLAAGLPVRGLVQQLAQQTELVRWEEKNGGMLIHLKSPAVTLCAPNYVGKLAAVLEAHFGCPVAITTETGKVETTVSRNAARARAERQQQAEEAMNNDPYLRNLTDVFGGHIVEGSIKPL